MVTYCRKGYVRADGTRVRGTRVRSRGSGRSRGRKSGGHYSRRSRDAQGYKPWIKNEGKLGGEGFLSKSSEEQHRILDRCVKKHGYRSCLGSVMVLSRSRSINKTHGRKLEALKNYLKKKYGGEGSFGSRRSSRRRRSR